MLETNRELCIFYETGNDFSAKMEWNNVFICIVRVVLFVVHNFSDFQADSWVREAGTHFLPPKTI